MISKLLKILSSGLEVMRSNARLLMVGVLVFVFPILFVWATQSFFIIATDNIQITEKNRVGMLHDTLTGLIISDSGHEIVQSTIDTILARGEGDWIELAQVAIYKEDGDGLVVVNSNIHDQIGKTYSSTTVVARSLLQDKPFSDKYDFHLSSYLVNETYISQASQRIERPDGNIYIVSDYDYTRFEKELAFRKNKAYFVLTPIFVFLIALAYWIFRQDDWRRKADELSQKIKDRDLFSNMIAHEFRSPLTAIKGYASFLEESKSISDDEKRFASNIKNSAEHLVALVSDFLEVARLQTGKLKIEMKDVDVRNVLTSTVETLASTAKEKDLELKYEPTKKPIKLYTDPARLTQVLTNVVSNAIKYTKQGTVELKCTEDYNKVVIRVMDTGMGISAEDQKKLFAPFTRVGGVDQGPEKGTGLGMYITKQLVDLLGGTVGVESIKGVGSHIVLKFEDKD